jgi:hypothetical protein
MLIPVHLCSVENDTGALHSATVNWCCNLSVFSYHLLTIPFCLLLQNDFYLTEFMVCFCFVASAVPFF